MARLYGIAGHGAGDPGACAHGYSEAERVRALGARMEALSGDEFVLLDPTRNWYADGGIYYLSLPRGAQLVELHMDSAGSGARGGHVVIDADFEPDGYDRALADFISGYFPGRSVTISKRNDLGNPNAAQYRGISYRLLECCFITSWEDLKKFNENLDDVARGILGALGIGDGIEEKEEDGMNLGDRITDGYIMDGTTYATVGNCLYWAESNGEKTLALVRQLSAQVTALGAAVEALSAAQGADPEEIAAKVGAAVEAKLEGISLAVDVE